MCNDEKVCSINCTLFLSNRTIKFICNAEIEPFNLFILWVNVGMIIALYNFVKKKYK